MMQCEDVRNYDITGGEKVEFGYYSALEVIFKQFLHRLESFYYDEFNLPFNINFDIVTGTKFSRYIEQIEQPLPIFVFELPPLRGEGLLLLDNRSANLIFSKEQLHKNKRVGIDNRFRIDTDNCEAVKKHVESVLTLFDESWQRIYKVKSKLKKLVSNKIKAKVMSPAESCIIVRINFSQADFQTYWEFCFSAYHLDRIIKQYGSKALLAGNGEAQEDDKIRQYFTDLLFDDSAYELTGVLGSLSVSQRDLEESYSTHSVIPIKNEIDQNVVIKLNRIPVLSASVGLTNDNISVQLNGKLEKIRAKIKQKNKPFSPLRFPSA